MAVSNARHRFVGFVLAAFIAFLHGYLVQKYWSWFVVPATSFRSLTIYQGIGLALGVSYICGKGSGIFDFEVPSAETMVQRFIVDVTFDKAVPILVLLLLGLLLHGFSVAALLN